MELTQEILDRYSGGQIEIQNTREGYLFRGEIESARLDGEGDLSALVVDLGWLARYNEGSWFVTDAEPYEISLLLYAVHAVSEDRLVLNSEIMGELTVLFQPGASTLDPTKVIGLTVSS